MNSFTNGLQVRVAAKTLEAIDICSFELVAVDGQGLPAFSAGSHVDVQVSEGVTRQYSLCNDPAESHRYVIAVLKDPNTRGGSKAMHERVQPGDVLTISPPKNHFPLAHGASRSLLLAGGIGVTPILCMAERLSCWAASSKCTMRPAPEIAPPSPLASNRRLTLACSVPLRRRRARTEAGRRSRVDRAVPVRTCTSAVRKDLWITCCRPRTPRAARGRDALRVLRAVVAKTDEDQSFQ
ncbi:ferredoxin reductase [Delftia lacustris]|uniref:ferredoxin reductase n=1 Tax=Delftia lacustris TaxID=558537 RepID=UPI002FC3B4DC